MKNIFIMLCVGAGLAGSLFSVNKASAIVNFNIKPNSVTDIPRLKPVDIPDAVIDNNLQMPPEAEEEPIFHPMRAGTLTMARKLAIRLRSVYKKIDDTKHLPPEEKQSLLNTIKDEKTKAIRLGNVIENTHNFEDVRDDVMKKFEEFVISTQLNIPKNIIRSRMRYNKKILDELEGVANKLTVYVSQLKESGKNVEEVEKKLIAMKQQLTIASEKFKSVQGTFSKMKDSATANEAKSYMPHREECGVTLKSMRLNFGEAKKLGGEVIDELENIVE